PTELVYQNRLYVSRSSDARLPAGRYKLGTLNLSGVGTGSYLIFTASAQTPPDASTAFGTDCEGLGGDNLYMLGRDWMDVGGLPYPTDATTNTSWGSIKARYR
ncbi:MAG TPA: hypothetical protein VLT84_00450, partial [Acidobacteriota bacterium]|nr:hypothetical protein [Acidobacteriota bacterium]